MGIAALIPVVCSLVSFVLAILGVFAGNTPGFLETNQVILLNTSALGRNFVPNLSTRSLSHAAHKVVVLADAAAARVGAAAAVATASGPSDPARRRLEPRLLTLSATEGVLAGLTAVEAADEMASVLGIHEFYSLHAMTLCEGDFAPNATADPTATAVWRNVSACSVPLRARTLNVTARLDAQLAAHIEGGCGTTSGGANASCLVALGASQTLLDALNGLPTLALVLAVFGILACVGNGLALLLAGASVVLGGPAAARRRELVLGNVAAATFGALALLVVALVLTISAANTVRSINRQGQDSVGVQATLGQTFVNTTWASFALIMIVSLYWFQQMHADSKAAAAKAAEKK